MTEDYLSGVWLSEMRELHLFISRAAGYQSDGVFHFRASHDLERNLSDSSLHKKMTFYWRRENFISKSWELAFFNHFLGKTAYANSAKQMGAQLRIQKSKLRIRDIYRLRWGCVAVVSWFYISARLKFRCSFERSLSPRATLRGTIVVATCTCFAVVVLSSGVLISDTRYSNVTCTHINVPSNLWTLRKRHPHVYPYCLSHQYFPLIFITSRYPREIKGQPWCP